MPVRRPLPLDQKIDHLLAGQRVTNTLLDKLIDLIITGANQPTNGTLNVTISFAGPLSVVLVPPPQPPAVSARITFRGETMPGQITVDTTDETVSIEWLDDKGDTDAAEPDGAVVTFTSDNEAVATVDDAGKITAVGEGVANIGASLTGSDGNPLLEADGTTPFAQPSPVAVTVSAGEAVGDALSLSV